MSLPPPTDPAIERTRIRAALAGDRQALDGWFRDHHPAVFRLCLGFMADSVEAEDACQDAMLLLIDRLGQWDAARSFTAWRNTVVLNLCRDRHRRIQRRLKAEHNAASIRFPKAVPSPDDGLHRQEVQRVLENALRTLPHREREAFVLRDLEGTETTEVAAAMGVSASTVRSLTTLARRRLRNLLAESLGTEHDEGALGV